MTAKSFFQKYHAVPAGDVGPNWQTATDEALIGWATADCELWDRGERGHLARMNEIWAELNRRAMERGFGPTATLVFKASSRILDRTKGRS